MDRFRKPLEGERMRNLGLSLIVVALAAVATPAAAAECDSSAAANHERVLAFYRLGLVDRQAREAFERYVSPDFIEHKPEIPGGTRQATADFLAGIITDVPGARWEIIRSAAEGDLVFVHARMTPAPGAPSYALADIFRVEDCQIVEHWDVVGPPVEAAGNPHSRF